MESFVFALDPVGLPGNLDNDSEGLRLFQQEVREHR